MKSIKEVSEELENDLQQYIESRYHLHHPRLLKERRALMDEGETATEPWVEATPTYVSGPPLRELGLPNEVVDLLKNLEDDDLDIFDPPYKHQADALNRSSMTRTTSSYPPERGPGKPRFSSTQYWASSPKRQHEERQLTNGDTDISSLSNERSRGGSTLADAPPLRR